MTSRTDVIAEIRGFLAETHPQAAEAVGADDSLFQLGLLDSLGIVSMVMFLEDRFAVSFQYDDLSEENLQSLGTIADLVLRYTMRQNGDGAR